MNNYKRTSGRQVGASGQKPRVSRRSSSADGRSSIPVRSMSTGRQNSTEALNLRKHGTAIGSISSRPSSAKRGCPKQLFRSQSTLTTPRPCIARGSLRLTTPQARLENKSPQRLRQQYTNLEEKVHLPRIRQFIAEHGDLTLEITKPVKINAFIEIVQLFKTVLMSPSMPEITNKNYKTAILTMMKTLKYPIPITQSFLKTPNTPQNFQHVLSIWAYLMDFVDVISVPWAGLTGASTLVFHFGNKSLDSLENRTEVEAMSLAQHGLTIDSYHKQKSHNLSEIEKASAQVNKIKIEVEAREYANHAKRESRSTLVKKREEQAKKTHEVRTLIKREQEQRHYSEKRSVRVKMEEQEKQAALDEVKSKIHTIGCTLDEVDALEDRIERCNHRLALLHQRHDELKELHRVQMDEQRHMEREALALIMHFNTQIMKSSLPEGQKLSLKLNEAEIRVAQVEQVSALVAQHLQQTAKYRDEYLVVQQQASSKFQESEAQLAEILLAAEKGKKTRIECETLLKQLNAEQVTLDKLIDDESRKIDMLKAAIEKAEAKRDVAVEATKKHYEEISFCMDRMKFYTEKLNAFFREKMTEVISNELDMLKSYQYGENV